ncbi:MAG: L-rhamnose mutarotase [Chitinophaga sp.]
MRFIVFFTALLAVVFLFPSCQHERLTEKVFVMQVKPGDDKLQEYLEYHRAVWPEVEKGFEHAGYRRIRLLRSHHTVVMIVEVPEGADLGEMGRKAEASDKRCAEWNRLMTGYQEGVAGTKPGETWTETEEFYLFEGK